MATACSVVYGAFLSKVLDDEWGLGNSANTIMEMTATEREADWMEILKAALPWFKFPRVSLDLNETDKTFENDLPNEVVQVIAYYMVYVWAQRCILTWENIKPLYEERDFSQANLLKALADTAEQARKEAKRLEDVYYRSRSGKSFDYSLLAGEN